MAYVYFPSVAKTTSESTEKRAGASPTIAENYMQNPRGSHSVPGALDLGQATATNISNAFFLFSFLTPMLFGLVSDIWLGRYRTLMVGLTYAACLSSLGRGPQRLQQVDLLA